MGKTYRIGGHAPRIAIGIVLTILLLRVGVAYADSQLTYAQVNGQTLSASNPTITVSPGASLTGTINVDLKDPCSSCAIYSVGINSWDRSYYSDLGGFSGDSQWHNKQFSFSFTAPSSSGTYYIAIGYGLCYAAVDVVYGCYGLSDSRRGQTGGGDDIWDTANWESMMPANQPSGAWRAIKIIVQQPSTTTDSAIIASFNPPSGIKNPGDSTSSSVTLKNTGTSTRSYWVGLSYQKPDGTWYDVPPQQTNTLSPNSQQTLTFYWNLPSNAPSGSYNARTAVWNSYNPSTNLMVDPRYDYKDVASTFNVQVVSDAASIISFNPPTGTKNPGDSISSSVTLKNTGTSTRSYWVGLSYQKPDGTWFDVPPQQTNTLSPNSQQTLTFYWNLPSNAPSGSYNARTAAWNGYNPSTNLMTEPKYDQKDISNAFTCCIPIITPIITPPPGEYYWKDDFNYASLNEMKNAGWTPNYEPFTRVGSGFVTLDNDGSMGASINYNNFPSGLYDWRAEAKGMWIGRTYGTLTINVETERHSYQWWGDGYYPEFVFTRDGVKVLRFPGYSPSLNQWYTFALERKGNTFYMYINGELKNTYAETDMQPSAFKSIGTNAGWISTVRLSFCIECNSNYYPDYSSYYANCNNTYSNPKSNC